MTAVLATVDGAVDASLALVGDRHGLLLAGPSASEGAETLPAHRARLGDLPARSPEVIRQILRESGLEGRGGGAFPLWKKVEATLRGDGEPVVIVNCSESEPASRKDRTICTLRPHLMLDGAAALARGVGSTEVTLHLHRTSSVVAGVLRAAIGERSGVPGDPRWRLSLGPDGFVAGESSAVARFVHEGTALPEFRTVPLARRGPSGRPTLVSNAETAAQAALLLRSGPGAFAAAGSPGHPGSFLATVTGAVERPGTVVEVLGGATIGDILRVAGGVTGVPPGILVGGYGGTWLTGPVAWYLPMEPSALAAFGAARGCGLVGVLPRGACGLAEASRLATYLAGESAGQCGSCVRGLPAVADQLQRLARGELGRGGVRRLRAALRSVPGSGACGHPDGVAHMVTSALATFDDDVRAHVGGRPCPGTGHPPAFATGRPRGRS